MSSERLLYSVDIGLLDGFEEAAGGEHHVVAEGGADQHLVVVAGIVEEEVEAVVHEIGAHGTAEALLVGDAIDADDGDVLAARLVVGIVVLAGVDAVGDVQLAGVDAVQDVEGVDVAGVHAKQDDALVQALGGRDEALPGPVAEEGLARRKKVFLRRQDGAVVIEARIRPVREPFKSVLAVLLDGSMKLPELLHDGSE